MGILKCSAWISVLIAVAGLMLDVLSTFRNVGAYGFLSEGNLALRESMQRYGVPLALAGYALLRLCALAIPLVVAFVVWRLCRGRVDPCEARKVRSAMSLVRMAWAGFCAAVWWSQGIANLLFPLIPEAY